MIDNRPDPDALLALAQAEEERAQRGRLKIFFGATAGVGKTYAMLGAAHELKRRGVDVVIGWVDTHGRQETEALLQGLEILPPRIVEHRGITLKDFDLDAALARRPAVLLVDELAHTNAPGARHAKRWQDVEKLLAAGLDVWTAINLQHLESLNDLVGKITDVAVRETVPDSFFDRADQVELVDLPAEELIRRLEEGKVYISDQTARSSGFSYLWSLGVVALCTGLSALLFGALEPVNLVMVFLLGSAALLARHRRSPRRPSR